MLKQLAGSPQRQRAAARKATLVGPAIAIVGCGYWGIKHVRVLSGMRDVRQVYAVESDAAIRRRIQSSFPNVVTASALSEVLGDVDGVIVATPPHNHAEVALAALRAGRHVLIEKPIATSVKDANRILRAAKDNDAIVMAGHTYEFNPVVHELRRRIAEGELGAVRYIHSSRLNLGLYRNDVNVVWDLAPHDVSIMNFLLGECPKEVQAWGSSCMMQGIIDVAHYQLKYSNGVVGYGFNSWIDPRKIRQLTVVGSSKMAVFDDIAEEKLRIFDHHVELPEGFDRLNQGAVPMPVGYSRGDVVSPNIEYGEPLLAEDQSFVSAICGREAVKVDGRTGQEVVKVLEAIDESMTNGRPALVGAARRALLN